MTASIEFLSRHSPLHRTLVVAPHVRVTPHAEHDRFVATVGGRHPLTLTREVAHLLVDLRHPKTVAQVARVSHLSTREVVEVLGVLERKGFVASPDASAPLGRRARLDTSGFPVIRLDPTFKAPWIDRLAERLAFLLRSGVVGVNLLLFALLVVCEFVWPTLADANRPMPWWETLALVAALALSSLVHELGHMTACRRCGIEHGGLGMALYLLFPALYVDVSAVYHLDRRGRLLVNGAGLYFSVLTLMFVLVCSRVWPSVLLTHLAQAIALTVVWNALPLRHLDGDWLARDLLGHRATALRQLRLWATLGVALSSAITIWRTFETYAVQQAVSCRSFSQCWQDFSPVVVEQPMIIGAFAIMLFGCFQFFKILFVPSIHKHT